MDKEMIRKMPKAELHCHLDGSVSLAALRRLAGDRGLDETKVKAPVPCYSLAQYLQCFGVVLPLMQTEEALSLCAYDVIRQAAEENVIYMEIRFAPAFHCNEGLTEAEACRAVLRGMEQGEKEFGVKSRALLCAMRGNTEEQNLRTLRCAKELQGYGVGGLDLAGDEAGYPTRLYRDLFAEAVKYDIPFTIHSGECGSADNVRDAVEMGARRIGHGVAAAGREDVLDLCRKNQVCFEMCPVSNLQTRAIEDLSAYPFLKMQREGLDVTLNTDNRTVSDTTLTGDICTLAEQFPEITEEVIRKANETALHGAFLPEHEKRELLRKMQA